MWRLQMMKVHGRSVYYLHQIWAWVQRVHPWNTRLDLTIAACPCSLSLMPCLMTQPKLFPQWWEWKVWSTLTCTHTLKRPPHAFQQHSTNLFGKYFWKIFIHNAFAHVKSNGYLQKLSIGSSFLGMVGWSCHHTHLLFSTLDQERYRGRKRHSRQKSLRVLPCHGARLQLHALMQWSMVVTRSSSSIWSIYSAQFQVLLNPGFLSESLRDTDFVIYFSSSAGVLVLDVL